MNIFNISFRQSKFLALALGTVMVFSVALSAIAQVTTDEGSVIPTDNVGGNSTSITSDEPSVPAEVTEQAEPAEVTDSTPSESSGQEASPQADTTETTDTGSTDQAAAVVVPTISPELPAVSTPELSTDKDDYHPGQTATIFGKFFSPLQSFFLKVFGSDENDQNYTEQTQTVTTDENGSFSATYTLDNLYRPFYKFNVSDMFGNKLAESYFRDSSVGTYDQCSNDDGDGYATGSDQGCKWINGNLNGSNSTYQEGDSTVQRLWLRGYAPGTPHTIVLQYGTTKGGKHAYDFLTSWNHSESWIAVADLCQDITNCVGTSPISQAAIPQDPQAQGFDNFVRNIEVRGASSASVSVPTVVSGTYGGDSETQVTISFTVDSVDGANDMCTTSGGIPSCDVAIFFGAHIAKTINWTGYDGTTGATTIPGSPYHVSLASEDGASIGSRDNQMQASAIPATITIIKRTVGDNGTFDFTTTGGNGLASNFSIVTNNNVGLSASYSITKKGTYTVTEGALGAGWSLTSITCDDPTTNSTVNVGTKTATIDLADGESVICTFTNTKVQNGTIIVDKVTNPSGDSQSFSFDSSGGSYADFALTDAAQPNSQSLVAGTYSVSETVPAGWTQTSATCVSSIGDTETIGNLELDPNETITCTFTNTKYGHIIIDKVTNPSGDPQSFSFNTNSVNGYANFALTDQDSPNDQGLLPGSYSVTENTPSGWTLTNLVCDSGNNTTDLNTRTASIGLEAGETVHCTFTNAKDATLKLVKTVTNDNGGTATEGDFQAKIDGNNVPWNVAQVVSASSHTASETTLPTYTASSWGGDCAANGSVTLSPGQNKTCTITNNDNAPTLKLVKTVTNDNGGTAVANDWDLVATGNGGFTELTPASANATAHNVNAGVGYSLSETGPTGYTAGSWSCDVGTQNGSTITLSLGQNATCTINNNDIAPKLHLRKIVTNDNGGTATLADFTLTANGAGSNDLSGTSPVDSGAGLLADTWALSETSVAGYTASDWVCVGGTQNGSNITVGIGGEATCTITNNDQQAYITVVKVVTNNNGGTAQPNDFNLTLEGNAVTSGVAVPVNPGTYTAGETLVSGYSFVGFTGDCDSNGDTTVALGESKTCTLTNDDIQPKLTLIKHVTNDNGGTAIVSDFPLFVDQTGVTSGVKNGFNAGSYTASETPKNGYTASSWSGDCAANGSITLNVGDDKTCEITNNDQTAHLKLVKVVTNDNGGNAVATDFTLSASGPTPISGAGGAESDVNAGAYNLSETSVAGYTASAWSCVGGAQNGASVTLALGESATCTITNTDNPPSLTLVKQVINDNGGTAVAGDWTLTASGYDTQSPDAGTYNLSESGPAGYTQTSLTCSNSQGQVTSVTLGLGENVTCTFVNDDIAPTLKLVKTVDNQFGGNAIVSDFILKIDGFTVTSGVASTTNAGLHTASEINISGYTSGVWGGDCAADGSVTLDLAENKTCTITNTDQPAKIVLIKEVVNDNGGTATPNQFGLTVGGGAVTSGATTTVNSNIPITLNEAGLTGYSFVSITGDAKCPDVLGGTVTLDEGETVTCVITNNDIAPKLTLVKSVTNDDGGNAVVSDFPLFINENPVTSGVKNTLSANTLYTATETNQTGYTPSVWGGDCDEDGTITLNPGDDKTCTITNDDIAPTLKLVKIVVSDNGGDEDANDWTLSADALAPKDTRNFNTLGGSGVFETVFANTGYDLSESSIPGYAAGAWSCDDGVLVGSTITLTEGETGVTCTITNDDIAPELTVIKHVINDNGGSAVVGDFDISINNNELTFGNGNVNGSTTSYTTTPVVLANTAYSLTEADLTGYTEGSFNCVDNVNQQPVSLPLDLNEGQSVTCEITNDDIAPKLHLRKVVVNNNGGTTTEAAFTLTANGTGSNDLSGVTPVNSGPTLQADTWALSETNVSGYTASNWVCVGGTQVDANITVGVGGEATCTITNDDQTGHLVVHKVTDPANDQTPFSITLDSAPVTGNATQDLSTSADVNYEVNAGFYSVDEADEAGWDETGNTCANVFVANGETEHCTITNTKKGHLIVDKVTDPAGDTTQFSIVANGTGVITGGGAGSVTDAVNKDYEVTPGTYSVTETVPSGWDDISNTCTNVVIAPGETETCTITNVKLGSLKIVKNSDPDDEQNITFTRNFGADFILDDDNGLDNTYQNNVPFSDLIPGAYTVNETVPNVYWKLQGITCTDVDTGQAYTNITTTATGVTVNLTAGKNVSCTFLNHKDSPTRTQGFWQTHTAATAYVFGLPTMQRYVGINQPVSLNPITHKGQITNTQAPNQSELLGAFYANIANKSTGKGKLAQRTDIDKARMQLLQQLVAAKLNCAAFGCSVSVQTNINAADAAYAGDNKALILSYVGIMDAYNNSGDTLAIPTITQSKATPKTSQSYANISFWDLP